MYSFTPFGTPIRISTIPAYGVPAVPAYGVPSYSSSSSKMDISYTYNGAGCIIYDPVDKKVYLSYQGSEFREFGGGINGKTLEEVAANNIYIQFERTLPLNSFQNTISKSKYYDVSMGSGQYRFYIYIFNNFGSKLVKYNMNISKKHKEGNTLMINGFDIGTILTMKNILPQVQYVITKAYREGCFY